VIVRTDCIVIAVCCCYDQATGYASQHIWCLSQAKINWEGCGRKGIRHKNGGDDLRGSLISPDEVASSWIVGVSVSVIFPCALKSRRRFLLAPAHPGSHGKMAVKRFCVCFCVCCYDGCVHVVLQTFW